MQKSLKFSQKSQLLEEKENWNCLHIAWCQQLHQTEHDKDESASAPPQPPKKRNVKDNNLATHGDLYLHSEKIIDQLPDSYEGKERCSLRRWVGTYMGITG